MRRLCVISATLYIFACLLLGCSRQQPAKDDDKKPVEIDPKKVKIDPQPIAKNGDDKDKKKIGVGPKQAADDAQEKYEEALAHALSALAERNWNEALEAFESAKTFQD